MGRGGGLKVELGMRKGEGGMKKAECIGHGA